MAADTNPSGVTYYPPGKKVFIPLENNPEVFTSLAHDLGLSPSLSFHDVYSLDDPDLLSIIPRPALALIFIAPPNAYYALSALETDRDWQESRAAGREKGTQQPVLWIPQTIGNACGLMALIHGALNGAARAYIRPGSLLADIDAQVRTLDDPDARAKLLHDSEALETAHTRSAQVGDTAVPEAVKVANYHFVAFVRGDDGRLWQLDGSEGGMVRRGFVPEGQDMLGDDVLKDGVKRFMEAGEGNPEFSIVALCDGSAESG